MDRTRRTTRSHGRGITRDTRQRRSRRLPTGRCKPSGAPCFTRCRISNTQMCSTMRRCRVGTRLPGRGRTGSRRYPPWARYDHSYEPDGTVEPEGTTPGVPGCVWRPFEHPRKISVRCKIWPQTGNSSSTRDFVRELLLFRLLKLRDDVTRSCPRGARTPDRGTRTRPSPP